MQARKETMRPGSWLWLGAVAVTTMMMMEMTSAYSNFCARPANMELCWFNKINKRFLRFGRGDPFLRFGKRTSDLEDLEGGFLRFGRTLAQPTLSDLLTPEGAGSSRKRRDVSAALENEAPALKRSARDVKAGGFLRFGRGAEGGEDGYYSFEEPEASPLETLALKRSALEAPEYLRFGRGTTFPRWGKRYLRLGKRYLRFGRGQAEGFLRFGKRSV